ncbi:hypothetical protein ABPG74_016825 [Tetrahymena malaccensis]
MLSLTSSDIPLVYKNSLAKLVTSLPYVDAEADDNIKIKVQRLIKQEMALMEKQDYLQDLPMPKTHLYDSPLIQEELQRVKNLQLLEEPQILQLPNLDLDTAESSQLKEFNDIASKINQYNNIKQVNLELMLKYGPDSHKLFMEYQKNFKNELNSMNEKLKAQIEEVNSKRKFDQSNANDKLSNYQYKIGNLLRRNEELEVECQKIEHEVLCLRKKQLKLN